MDRTYSLTLGSARYDYERARVRVYKIQEHAVCSGTVDGRWLRVAMRAEMTAAHRYSQLLRTAAGTPPR